MKESGKNKLTRFGIPLKNRRAAFITLPHDTLTHEDLIQIHTWLTNNWTQLLSRPTFEKTEPIPESEIPEPELTEPVVSEDELPDCPECDGTGMLEDDSTCEKCKGQGVLVKP